MTFKENINKNEFENFVGHHETKSHFMQSTYFGEISKEKGFKPILCGLYDKDNLVGTALVLKKPLPFNLSYFYIPRGYVIDFSNDKVLKEMTDNIIKLAKKNNAIFVTIDPDIKLEDIDANGKPIKDLNHNLVDKMIKMGYVHKGFNYNFEHREPRYTFRLDLTQDMDTINKNMHSTTRNILNRGNINDLNIYIGDKNDIDKFYFVMEETGKRQNIIPFKKEYYETFYDTFKKQNMSDLYVAEVNVKELKKIYNERIKNIKDEIKKEDKESKKLNDLNDQLTKLNKDLNNLNDISEDNVVLSSYITVKYGNKVWIVHGGNANYLRELNASYLVYEKIIHDAKEQGYKTLDFFGTIGKDTNDSTIHGLHLFKKRFGGEYTEFIGEFDLVINKFWYFMYNSVLPTYHKIGKAIIKAARK
jgi:peptidoglycan pentaglycine glycine transferase (the first glycine)